MCVGQLEVQVLQVPNCAVAHTRLFAAGRSRTTSVCELHIDSQALPKPKCHSGSAAVGTGFRTPGKATYSNPVAWRLYTQDALAAAAALSHGSTRIEKAPELASDPWIPHNLPW